MKLRICIEPGCGELTSGTRCTAHQQALDTARNASRPQYAGPWDRFARHEILRYRQTHGDTCPGFGRAPHPIEPEQWTCDHDLGPICRSCNSRKANLVDKPRAQFRRLRKSAPAPFVG